MIAVAWAGALVCAAGFVFVLWEASRTPRAYHRRALRRPGSRTTVTTGRGYRLITDSRLEVSSTQVYSNGTTQIWLKRRPAA